MLQRQLFEGVFSDAHVVDIDLSAWDKCITLYVLADHMGRTAHGHKPLFMVELVRVRRFTVEFNHFSVDQDLAPNQHMRWRIDSWELQTAPEGLMVKLAHRLTSPVVDVVCEDIRIREIPLDLPDQLFPGWSRPFSGFIRPGLDAMWRAATPARYSKRKRWRRDMRRWRPKSDSGPGWRLRAPDTSDEM